MAKSSTRTMTPQHKAALAEGRTEGRAVKSYLEALELNRPRRGRKRTPDSIKKRLAAIDTQIDEGSALQRAAAGAGAHGPPTGARAARHQDRPLGARIRVREDGGQVRERKGISYAAWRELGVSAEVLKKAGISRAS